MTTEPAWKVALAHLEAFTPKDVRRVMDELNLKLSVAEMEKLRARYRRTFNYENELIRSEVIVSALMSEPHRQRAFLEVVMFTSVGILHPSGHSFMHEVPPEMASIVESTVCMAADMFLEEYPTFLPALWDELLHRPVAA